MELKKRQANILTTLAKNTEGVSIKELLSTYGIAKRTLYYDIQIIDDWLTEKGLGDIKIESQKVSVHIAQRTQLNRQLGKGGSYFFSIEERRTIETICILLHYETVTIDKLRCFFDVSKNTILADIREIKQELDARDLHLGSTIKAGYNVEGDENAIRRLLGQYFTRLLNVECVTCVKKHLQDTLVKFTGNDIDFSAISVSIIHQYASDVQGGAVLSNTQYESMRIQMALIRSMMGKSIQMNEEEQYTLMDTAAYRSLEISAEKLKKHQIIIPDNELYYITSLFLGMHMTEMQTREQEDFFMEKICAELVWNFERIGCLYFADKERLKKQLIRHVKPLYYRMKYGMSANNPMKDDIKKMYSVLFDITKKAFMEKNITFSLPPTDDELAYICIYMAANLSEYAAIQNTPGEEILIIGPDNMAMAAFVQEQLEQFLGKSFKYTVVSQRQAKRRNLNQYLLVVSFEDLGEDAAFDYLSVSAPVLSDYSKQRIIDILKEKGVSSRVDAQIQEMLDIFRKHVDLSEKEHQIYFDLFRYFNEKNSAQNKDLMQRNFADKIVNSRLIRVEETVGWEEAVLVGSEALQGGKGHLTERMRNLMLKHKVHTYRLHPDVELIHCPMMGDADGEVTMCILVDREEILCDDGEHAHILVFLSTIDNYSHLGMLRDIFRFFETENCVKSIQRVYQTDKIPGKKRRVDYKEDQPEE